MRVLRSHGYLPLISPQPPEAATGRGKALERFRLIRPFLQEGVALTGIWFVLEASVFGSTEEHITSLSN
jgi:hypothetical protein